MCLVTEVEKRILLLCLKFSLNSVQMSRSNTVACK